MGTSLTALDNSRIAQFYKVGYIRVRALLTKSTSHTDMDRQKKLDKAAKKLLDIFESHAKDVPASERKAKWSAFSRVVSKIDTPARPQATSRTLETPRVD